MQLHNICMERILSVIFAIDFYRIPPVKRNEKGDDGDLVQPVYVGEFPLAVRDEQQAALVQKQYPGLCSLFSL